MTQEVKTVIIGVINELACVNEGEDGLHDGKVGEQIEKLQALLAPVKDQGLLTIAEELEKVSAAVQALTQGPLTERAVVILLKDYTGLGMQDIQTFLRGTAALSEKYTKPVETDE